MSLLSRYVERPRANTSNSNAASQGVLIAQIGVAGLSLPLIHQTHWLASGFFVVGIVGAILAVYKSTVSRKLIGSLLEPEDIRLWLSAPAAAMTLPTTNRTSTVSNSAQPAPNNSHRTSDRPRPIPPPIITHDSQTSEPSLYAALILSLPSMFLQTSLSSILLALATYLSSIRSRHLSIDGTKVFIFFLISTFALIGIYYISKTLKEMEQQQMTRRKRPSSSDTEHAVVTEDEARTPNTNRRRRMTPVATTQRRRDRGSGSWVRSRSHGRHH